MTARLCVSVVLCSGLFGLQAQQNESTTPSATRESPLRKKVRVTRDMGETKLDLPHVISTPVRVTTLADAAERYAFIVASPIDNVVVPDEEGLFLTTWYKFRATKVLFYASPRPPIQRRRNSTHEKAPNDLTPLGPMEFLLPVLGGEALIDGVEVKSTSTGHNRFDEQDSYLMIVDLDNETGKVASLPYGAHGLFRLDGDDLQPAVLQSSNPLALEIRDKFNRSFKALESALRRPRANGF